MNQQTNLLKGKFLLTTPAVGGMKQSPQMMTHDNTTNRSGSYITYPPKGSTLQAKMVIWKKEKHIKLDSQCTDC